jgi:hypothetical protein
MTFGIRGVSSARHRTRRRHREAFGLHERPGRSAARVVAAQPVWTSADDRPFRSILLNSRQKELYDGHRSLAHDACRLGSNFRGSCFGRIEEYTDQ